MAEIDIFIEQLSDLDPQVRRFAAKKLRDHPDPKAAFALSQHLGDNDIFVRNYATDALIKIGEPALKYVIEQIDNPSDEVRNRILTIYKELKTTKFVDRLIPLLKDQDDEIRKLTKIYLSKYLNEDAVSDLTRILKDKDAPQDLRITAKQILLSQPLQNVDELVEIVRNDNNDMDFFARDAAAEIIINSMKEGHDVFEKRLHDECPQVRRGAVITIGKRQGKKASLKIGDFLKDPDKNVRETTANVLGEIGDPTVIGLLRKAMDDTSLGIWHACKEAIKKIEEKT